MNLATLKAELTNDPIARGYAAMTRPTDGGPQPDDEAIAKSLNTADRNVDVSIIDGGMLVASVVRSEFASLSAADKQYVQLVAMASQIPLTSTVKTELGAVFGAGTATRANMLALMKKTGTRGEELGLGFVTPSDVANARRLA